MSKGEGKLLLLLTRHGLDRGRLHRYRSVMRDPADAELADLRRIGWDHWDPIGIRHSNSDDWQGPAAGEYDSYMLHVARLLRRGTPQERVAAYLDWVAGDHMGLGPVSAGGHACSANTVAAVALYLKT